MGVSQFFSPGIRRFAVLTALALAPAPALAFNHGKPTPTPTAAESPAPALGDLNASYVINDGQNIGTEADPSAGIVGSYNLDLPDLVNKVFFDVFPKVTVPQIDGKYVINFGDVFDLRRDLSNADLHKYYDLGNTQVTANTLRAGVETNGQVPLSRDAMYLIEYQQFLTNTVPAFLTRDFSKVDYRNPLSGGHDLESAILGLANDCAQYGNCETNANGQRYLPWAWTWFDFELTFGSGYTQDDINAYIFIQWELNKISKPGYPAYLDGQASMGLYGTLDLPAKETPNSAPHGYPAELYGKTLRDLTPVIAHDQYFFYEDFLPQGTAIYDHNGAPYLYSPGSQVKIDHYAVEGARNWADLICGGLERNAKLVHPDQMLSLNLGLYDLAGGHGFMLDAGPGGLSSEASITDPKALPNYVPIDPVTNSAGSLFNNPIPRFPAEVLGLIPTFMGVKYVSNWQDPTLKPGPAKPSADATHDDVDLRNYDYYHASKARLFNQKVQINGTGVAVADLLDQYAVFLRDQTEVEYFGFKNISAHGHRIESFFKATSEQRRMNRLPYVYQIVNPVKGLIATLAFKPYGSGSDVTGTVRVRYKNYLRTISIPDNQAVLIIDPIPVTASAPRPAAPDQN